APALWPFAAAAQRGAMPVIGFLNSRSDDAVLTAFHRGLRETGFIEKQNVAIEYRSADGRDERLPALVADLVRRRVAVIATNGPGAVAAKAATTTIPIVFNLAIDPVEVGFVASLNRPGGNLTGITSLGAEVGPKRLQLLHEMVPTATTIGVLVDP